MIRMFSVTVLGVLSAGISISASGGKADVLSVRVSCDKARVCRFAVTVQHADNGWEHYADRWDVVAPDGTVLATRVLAHPHDHEQPFTRSLGKVSVPADVAEVIIRARDSKHGYGGKERRVTIDD